MAETITGMLLATFGEIVLKHALEEVLHSSRSSSQLANAIVSDPSFAGLDKERLLTDPRYFNGILEGLKTIHTRISSSVSTILSDPSNTKTIQSHLVSHPLLRDPIQRFCQVKRFNFLILGHQRAGKTSLIQRMLFSLARDPEIGLLFGDVEPVEILDKTARYKMYDTQLMKLAGNNEMLDRGATMATTATELEFYLDIEHYQSGQILRLKFFDYAGGNLDDFETFLKMVGDRPIDGILIMVDAHRLIAEELRAGAYASRLLEKEKHEAEFAETIKANLRQIEQVTTGLLLRVKAVKRDGIPVCFTLTKCDGFDQFGQAEASARGLLYRRLEATLLSLANMGMHSLAVCLTSALGKSTLARDEKGELRFDNQFTGLPALAPVGSFGLAQYEVAALPLKFLINTQVQQGIADIREMLTRCKSELSFLERVRHERRFNQLIEKLDQENRRWDTAHLVSRARSSFVVLPQKHPSPADLLDHFFLE